LRNFILISLLLVTSSIFGQVTRIDRSDTSIHVVYDFFTYDHWRMYPATSAVYIPPCVYRIVPPDSSEVDLIDSYDIFGGDQFRLIEQHDKYGIVNAGDTVIIPIQYDSLVRITSTHPRVFIAKKKKKFGLLNAKNEVVIPFKYDGIYLLTNGHYNGFMNSSLRVEKDGKVGLMRMDGSTEVSCKYDYIDTWCHQVDCPMEGIQYYVGIDGEYGYVNQDESFAINLGYEALNADGFSGLIKAKNNGKVGLMDTLENFIVPQKYEKLYREYMPRFPHLTSFKKDGKWGLMSGEYSDMEIVLENEFDSVMCHSEFKDHFIIINDEKWGLADTNGKVVVQPQFQGIQAMEDGNFAYKKDGKWGFMSQTGKINCSPRYDAIYDNDKNWCLVTSGDGFGFCKTSGLQIVEPIYRLPFWDDYLDWGGLLYSGRIAMSKKEGDYDCKMGVIDSTGKVLLPFEYECLDELVYNFGSALIAVKNGKDVIINEEGKEVDLGDYDKIERRGNWKEYFFPIKGEKVGLVSPRGKLLSKPKYDRIEFLWWNREREDATLFFLVEQNFKFGLLDSNGAIILAPIYDGLALNDKEFIELISESEVKLYNLKTKEYVPFTALNISLFNGEIGVFNGAGGKVFFIDSLGSRINEDDYRNIRLMGPQSKYFQVESGGRYGICDATGKPIFEPIFSKIKFWDGEFGAGKSGNHYCFFNANGDTLVGYRYEKVKGVFENFVCVRIKGKFGVVNKKGETVIAPTLQSKLSFELLKEFGLTTVNENFKVGVVNKEMEKILSIKYDTVELIKEQSVTYIITTLNGGIELYNATGNLLSTGLYTKWEQNEAGKLFLFNGLTWFKLNEHGELEETEK
jgi:hypothetical protein